jgi:hypothetical protein
MHGEYKVKFSDAQLTNIYLKKCLLYLHTYSSVIFPVGLCILVDECKLQNLSDTAQLQAEVCLLNHRTNVVTKVIKLHQIQSVGQSLQK